MTRVTGPGGEAAWTAADPSEYPELPYPGARPAGSWRLTAAGGLHALKQLGGERVQDLATAETFSLAGRHLVLAYGSNANPQKLLDLPGADVFALEAEIEGWAAVWCPKRRTRDDVVVCTLAPMVDIRERHVVLAVTRDQREVMDKWEGHPGCYERVRFTGRLALDDGSGPAVEVYLGTHRRPALLVGGRPLRCAEISNAEVDPLVRMRT